MVNSFVFCDGGKTTLSLFTASSLIGRVAPTSTSEGL